MNEVDRAREILAMADKDLSALRGMLDPEVFATEVFGFHGQQAIEKALKAWIIVLGSDYQLTHNIITLLDQVSESGGIADRFWGLAKYNAFAVQFRYEEFGQSYGEFDRPRLLAEVSELVGHVRRQLDGPEDEQQGNLFEGVEEDETGM